MMEQIHFSTGISQISQRGSYSLQEIQEANLSPEEKLIKSRERNRESAAIRRAYMPSDKLEMERKRGREYMALKRAFMTQEEKELENKKNRERVRLKRMYLPEEKKEQIRKQQRERLARKRAAMTPEQKSQIRERWRIQMKEKRASLSEEEKARLRTYNREKAREYRNRKHQGAEFPGAWTPYQMCQPGPNPTNASTQQPVSKDKVLTLPVFPTPLNNGINPAAVVPKEENQTVTTVGGPQYGSQLTQGTETGGNLGVSQQGGKYQESDPGMVPQPQFVPVQSNPPATLPGGIQKPFQIVYKAVHKFRRFCFEKHKTEEFEHLDKPAINELLAEFYSKVEQLPWMGLQMTEFLVIMKEGLACFMRDFLQTDIENDPAFDTANAAFVKRLEMLLDKMNPHIVDETGEIAETLNEYAEASLVVDEAVTMKVVQFFQKYLVHQGKSENFETFSKEDLIESLHGFYVYAKMMPQKGLPEPYRILRLRLAHYIKTKMNVDIIHDPDFELANRVCKANMTKLEQHLQGAPLETSHPPGGISFKDLIALFQSPSMNPNHPQGLLNLCMFNVIFYLCQSIAHGLSESMRLMDKGTFLFETDEQNNEYVAWQSTYLERMPAIIGHFLCPVFNLKKYLNKLSSSSSTLWQHPLKRSISSYNHMDVWYQVNIPMGSRKIQYFMEKLSVEAGLDTCYSNLSIQQTSRETITSALEKVKLMFSFAASDNFSMLPSQDQVQQMNINHNMNHARNLQENAVHLVSSLSDLDKHLDCVMWSRILPDWIHLKRMGHFENNVDFLKHLLNIYSSCISGSYTSSAGASHDNGSTHDNGPSTSGEMSMAVHKPDEASTSGEIVQTPLLHHEAGNEQEEECTSFLSMLQGNSERQEKGRRLDAVLASSLRTLGEKEKLGASSRRKPSIVQRKENYPAFDGNDGGTNFPVEDRAMEQQCGKAVGQTMN